MYYKNRNISGKNNKFTAKAGATKAVNCITKIAQIHSRLLSLEIKSLSDMQR